MDMRKKRRSYGRVQWEERKKLKLLWELLWEELKVLGEVRRSRT